jgi:hypothetical protein
MSEPAAGYEKRINRATPMISCTGELPERCITRIKPDENQVLRFKTIISSPSFIYVIRKLYRNWLGKGNVTRRKKAVSHRTQASLRSPICGYVNAKPYLVL